MRQFFYDNPHLFEYFGLILLLLSLFGISSIFPKTESVRKLLGLGLVLAPIAYFYLIIDAHLVNIPFIDDYMLLETVHNFRREKDFVEAVKILFSQVNQHRFAFERLVMLMLVFFTGTVNLKALITLGNLFLLGILSLFFQTFRQERVSWYYFLPIPFLLFNLTYYENANWGIAAIQNTPLIFFTMLSAYGLGRNDRAGWWIGAAAALVATFVSGTGMLAWIVGAIILFFQKKYKPLILWLGLTIGCLLFYFLFDYHYLPTAEGDRLWKHPIFNGLLLLGFWGNALYLDIPHTMQQAFYPDMVACIYLGLFMGLIFLSWLVRFFLRQKRRRSYWFVLGTLLFGLGTGAMFVLSRPMDQFFMYGGNVFSRRYVIFGVVSMAVTYLALVILTRRLRYGQPVLLMVGLAGFVALNFQSYFTSIVFLRQQHDELLLDAYYWKNYFTFFTQVDHFGDRPFWNHPTRMKELVEATESSGLSKLYDSDRFPMPSQLRAQTQDKSLTYKGTFGAGASCRIAETNYPAEYLEFYAENGTISATNFLLVSKSYVLPLPALPMPYSWEKFLKNRSYYSPRLRYDLLRSKLPPGQFRVWMMSPDPESGKNWDLRYTGRRMRLLSPT